MFIILNGPPGTGKLAVGEALVEQLGKSGLYHVPATSTATSEDVEEVWVHIRDRAFTDREWGGEHTVVVGLIATPEALSELRHKVVSFDPPTHAFRLRGRLPHADRGDEADQARFDIAQEELDRAEARGDLGRPMEVDGREARDVAAAILAEIQRPIEIVEPDPTWPEAFETAKRRLEEALGGVPTTIEHVGSTAVPGLPAKPVIDIAVGLRELEDFRQCIAPLKALGFIFTDYPENTERKVFSMKDPAIHVHLEPEDSAEFRQHLRFRDALRSRADWRDEYASLKRELATNHRNERYTYTNEKSDFIERVMAEYGDG